VRQAARQLGVTPGTIRRWVRRGVLAGDRLPAGDYRLDHAAIAAFADGRAAPATTRLNRVDDHLCFGCGQLNPFGLHLSFERDGDGVRTVLQPGRLREGWAGATHGGILATLLDEVMAWTLFDADTWAVTARMAITYRRPAPIGAPLVARGWVTRDRGRLVEVAAEAHADTGALVAEATGTFVRVNDEQRARLERLYGRK
jgi:excisionase family DNA binding protein